MLFRVIAQQVRLKVVGNGCHDVQQQHVSSAVIEQQLNPLLGTALLLTPVLKLLMGGEDGMLTR